MTIRMLGSVISGNSMSDAMVRLRAAVWTAVDFGSSAASLSSATSPERQCRSSTARHAPADTASVQRDWFSYSVMRRLWTCARSSQAAARSSSARNAASAWSKAPARYWHSASFEVQREHQLVVRPPVRLVEERDALSKYSTAAR